MSTSLRVELASSLRSLSPSAWNSLLHPLDPPLLDFHFLRALELASSVGPSSSWLPSYLLVWRESSAPSASGPELVAAAPCYLKGDSDGEWVFDLDWAEFAASIGRPYYPKLVVAVPFSPVSGGRLLCSPKLPAHEQQALRGLLIETLRHVVQAAGLSSCHILFPRMDDGLDTELAEQGFLLRRQEQYHFQNPGYRSFDDFLSQLRGHRRTSIRRERRALRDAGITVRTYRGLECAAGFSRTQLDAMFDMYYGTSLRYTGGPPYLNRKFFHLCAERLGDRLELVLAHGPGGQLLAGAWNLRGAQRLYGRYWGHAAGVQVPFLHFEVCYYHSIEQCIEQGLAVFEPGHGGDHKLLRGFAPVYTYSAHYLRESVLRQPIAAFLREEAVGVDEALALATKRCPIRSSDHSAVVARSWLGSAPEADGTGDVADSDGRASCPALPSDMASTPMPTGAVHERAGARRTKRSAPRKD